MLKFNVAGLALQDTLKNYLRKNKVSLTLWRKIKRLGKIYINEKLVAPSASIMPGDKIRIALPYQCTLSPIKLQLDICFEDETLLILDKPAGLVVHPTMSQDSITLANAVMAYYLETGQHCGFHPLHRLDRNTSGLIVIAKNPLVQHILATNNLKAIKRIYTAIVPGKLEPSFGIIEAPIARKPESIIERIVDPAGQSAVTIYKTIRTIRNASVIEVELLTGRTHQIRVHMSYIGHPILGDDLYGGEKTLISRQALHAGKLEFVHPLTKEVLNITCKLPADMENLISKISFQCE